MKKIIYLAVLSITTLCYSCNNNDDDIVTTDVNVKLVYPQENGAEPKEGVTVKFTDANGSTFEQTTNSSGVSTFKVPYGLYEASASDKRSAEGYAYIYNGTKSNIDINSSWTINDTVTLELMETEAGQIIIKELYVGGCPKDDGSGSFSFDKYAILYNNSDQSATLDNLCLGMVLPYNATSTNADYIGDRLYYEAEGWIPAGNGFWYFQNAVTLEPGEQIVVNCIGAIDNTQTYSQSINFANSEYYCCYDTEDYYNTSFYPAPASVIPTSNYLMAYKYGAGNAWPLSMSSPAFYIFRTKDSTPATFGTDESNLNYHKGKVSPANARKKVPTDWILDGIEVFAAGKDNNVKRLTANIDAGQISMTYKLGYSLYRNVDKEATEAISKNAGKLVYNYNMGTEVDGTMSTDLSGIDAEASIKNGARIVYMDTNNSSNDFHQREKASLRN